MARGYELSTFAEFPVHLARHEGRPSYILGERKANLVNDLYERMLAAALEEARYGLVEGGIPIGAAMFRTDGRTCKPGT